MFLFGLTMLLGCTPGRKVGGDVKGSVEFEGKPVNYGAITVIGEDRYTAMSEIKDGAFHLQKPPFGKCAVMIVTAPPMPPDGDMSNFKPPADYIDVPARYGRPETSKLEIDVTEAPQTHNIKLTR
jgi:hypothetical protein